jgi:hypothetical protein
MAGDKLGFGRYRGYLVLGFMFFIIILVYFFAFNLFWPYFIIILLGLVSGRLIKYYFGSDVVDKLVKVCAVGFAVPVFIVFLLLGLESQDIVSSMYSDVLIGVQFVFFSLFLSLYFDELSKSESDNARDKFELKVDELDEVCDDAVVALVKEFYEVTSLGNYAMLVNLPIKSYNKNNRLFECANDYLRPNLIILHPLVAGFQGFTNFCIFLKNIYFIWRGQMLDKEDYDKIYFGGLDERIVYGLDDFDLVEEVPEPSAEFFESMKNLKWSDDAKKLLTRLEGFREYYLLNNFKEDYKFFYAENSVINFLTACSALSRDGASADKEDIIMAYKTYFKLFKTDLTQINPLGDTEVYKN